MPASQVLDADAILAAAEDVLRRYGPEKATVVDVAVSTGTSGRQCPPDTADVRDSARGGDRC